MKKRITFFHVLKLFLLSAAIFLTTSCENFLNNGQSVKNEIEDAIAYNNAAAGNLHFWAETEKGSFLTGNEKNCKLGYSVEVQFVVKTASYKYDGMEAVDNKDQKTSLADCVEFEDITSDTEKENGIYRVKVKLLKQRDDILIRPICKLIPRVSEVTPKNESNGCDQDSVIKIVFNKPMNIQSFGNFECLSISSEGASVAEYFASPYFLDDKKTLCIEPLGVTDQTKLLLVPNGNIENKNISVELAFTGQELCEDGLALTQDIQHRYKINRNYRNFKKATVKMKPKNEMGEFTSGSSIEAIVGYSSELEFQLSKAYYFVGLHAVSQKNENTSLDSIVSFSTIQDGNKDSNGICKIKMIVNEKNDDILIVPECIKYPAVENLEPQFSTDGVNTNNPIVIHFNMPMEDAEVQAKDSLFKSPNISLVYTDSAKTNYDMSEYFEAPKFNQEKRTLTFIPKPVSLRSFIADLQHRSYIDIRLAFDEKITVTQQGITLSILQDENSSYTLRYKPDVETGKPVKPDGALFFATKDSGLTIEKAATFEESKKIPAGTFDDSHFTDSQTVLAHRVGSTIYIYGEYKDEGSGVRTVVVKEKLLNNKAGTDVSALNQFQTYQHDLYTDPTAQAQFDDSGTAKFCIAHQLHGDDGLMLLKISVQDACQNESAETIVTVVHDKEFGMGEVKPYNSSNALFFNTLHSTGCAFDKELFEQELNTIRLLQEQKPFPSPSVSGIKKQIYKNFNLDFQDIQIECSYYNDTESGTKSFIYNSETKEWLCTLDVNNLAGLKLDIIFYDDIGNSLKKTFQIPGYPFVVKDTGGYKMFCSDFPFCFPVGVSEIENQLKANAGSGSMLSSSLEGYIFLSDENFLFGPLSEIHQNDTIAVDNTLPEIVIKSVDFESVERSWKTTITIDESAWDYYDLICIQHYNNGAGSNASYSTIEPGVTNFSFTYSTNALWNYATEINVWGIKGNKRSAETTTTCPEKAFKNLENSSVYDNVPPTITNQTNTWGNIFDKLGTIARSFEYVNVSSSDELSGIQSIAWTINDSNKKYSGTYEDIAYGYIYNAIPVWDMDQSNASLVVTATDYNNNSSSVIKNVNFMDVPQYSIYGTELRAEDVSNIWKHWRVGVYVLEGSGEDWDWTLVDGASKNIPNYTLNPAYSETYHYYTYGNITLPEPSADPTEPQGLFFKVVTAASQSTSNDTEEYGISDPFYYYEGPSSSGSQTDYILMGIDGALVASDQPVFVETWSTKKPYEECRDWKYEQWIHRHKHLHPVVLNFTPTDRFPKKYTIPLNKLDDGECYVVIAHFANEFADGEDPVVSQVMIK